MAEIPAWPSLGNFQPTDGPGWFVTFADDSTLPVAGWGTFAYADGTRTLEPMVPDSSAGRIVAARELGDVAALEWKEGGA